MPADTTEPQWADDTNYSSGSRFAGRPTKNEPIDPAQGLVAGEPIPVDCINFALNKMIAWLADSGRGVYGDGSDGDATVTGGTTTLTRDMHYDNLLITGTGVLVTAGFRVFVRGTLTIQASGVIRRNGNAGSAPANSASGGTGAAALAAGTLGGSGAGGGGGNGSNAGSAGGSVTNAGGGSGGAGGASNDTGADANEAGGAAGTATAPTFGFRHLAAALGYTSDGTVLRGGGGGGGGGGGDTGTGGGGGSGGGVIAIFAYRIANAGTIEARGGAGGAAFTGPDAAGNGGGAGGGGGLIFVVSRAYTGVGTISVAGGAGGAGHLVGSAGAAGSTGTVVRLAA